MKGKKTHTHTHSTRFCNTCGRIFFLGRWARKRLLFFSLFAHCFVYVRARSVVVYLFGGGWDIYIYIYHGALQIRLKLPCPLSSCYPNAYPQEQNPNTKPNDGFVDGTSILAGEWELLFTSALDVLSLGLLPGIDPGQIFQNISEDGTEVWCIVFCVPVLCILHRSLLFAVCLKKNLNASRPSEHPPVRGENVVSWERTKGGDTEPERISLPFCDNFF